MAFRSETMSPDPLALSVTDCKPDFKPSPHPVTPTRKSKLSNGNFRLQDFYLTTPQAALLRTSSPTRSMAETENLLSPWRIRVRVEAERNDTHLALKPLSPSPVRRVGQWTRTTTVPLKGADDSTVPSGKRPRGRPRKSVDGPVKRRGTPKPRKSTTRIEAQAEDDDQQEQAIKQATPSNVGKNCATEAAEFDKYELVLSDHNSEPETAPKKRGRPKGSKDMPSTTVGETRNPRKTMSPVEKPSHTRFIPISSVTQMGRISRGFEQTSPKASNQKANKLIKDTTVLPKRALKRKWETGEEKRLPKQQPGPVMDDSRHTKMDVLEQEGAQIQLKTQRENLGSQDRNLGSLNEHREFDSVMESEGFSMVSVSTLPSAKQNFEASGTEVKSLIREHDLVSHVSEGQIATRGGQPNRIFPDSPTRISAKSTTLSPEGVLQKQNVTIGDVIASDFPSEGTDQRERLAFASTISTKENIPPSMGPPVVSNRPRESSRPVNFRRDESPIIRAINCASSTSKTIAQPLQTLSSPLIDTSQNSPKNFKDDPGFQLRGFGSGTRRHLKDGLHLGEELDLRNSDILNIDDQKPRGYSSLTGLNSKLSGFGAETTRELKAGLRLGEELSKRQRTIERGISKETHNMNEESSILSTVKNPNLLTPSESDVASQSHRHGDVVYPEMSANHRQHAKEVRYPNLPPNQLLSPERSNDLTESELDSEVEASLIHSDNEDCMSWKADTVKPSGYLATQNVPLPLPPLVNRDYDQAWARREAEWQHEREAISRQIQEANQSQVIVIGSSTIANGSKAPGNNENDEHAEGFYDQALDKEDSDIWQCEANNSRKLTKQPNHNTSANAPELLFPEAQIRPRRSKLPSPWRRQSSSNIVYSDEHALTDPDPFIPSPEKEEPKTPPQSYKRQLSRDDVTDFSNFSDFGRPIDECATVQFKRPRLVQSIEDKVPMTIEEGLRPHVGNGYDMAQRLNSDASDLDSASQLHGSNPTALRQRHVRTTIAGAKDLSMASAPGSQWLQAHSDCSLLQRSQASQCLQPPLQYPTYGAQSPQLLSRSRSQRRTRSPVQLQAVPSAQPTTNPTLTTYPEILKSIKPLSNLPPVHLPFALSVVASQAAAASPSTLLPFTLHHPWTNAHYLVLQPLYLKGRSQRDLYSYKPETSSTLLGKTIRSHGWSKTIEPWELGVVDAFMSILLERGVTLDVEKPSSESWWGGFKERVDAIMGRQGIKTWKELSRVDVIDEVEVAKRVFSLWVGRVQRGEEDLGKGVAGSFDEKYKAKEALFKRRA